MSRMRQRSVVSLHDVAPASLGASSTLLTLCERHGVRASLLVIPGPWRGGDPSSDSDFRRWLDGAVERGHEVSLHGWSHDGTGQANWRNRFVARGCGEFSALGRADAVGRIEQGLAVMERLGHRVRGFTPPGWLASTGTIEAVRAVGLEYLTTQRSVKVLTAGVDIRVPAVCQRPHSTLEPIAALAVRRYAVSRVSSGQSIRVALHPADLNSPAMFESATSLVQLAAFAGSTTYAELADGFIAVEAVT
jgi:predicted deacetylase